MTFGITDKKNFFSIITFYINLKQVKKACVNRWKLIIFHVELNGIPNLISTLLNYLELFKLFLNLFLNFSHFKNSGWNCNLSLLPEQVDIAICFYFPEAT